MSGGLKFSKGGKSDSLSGQNITIDITAKQFFHAIQTIGTSEETLSEGPISGAGGFIIIKNLDSTNYIDLSGDASAVNSIRIKAGEAAMFAPASDIQATANTAAVEVEYLWIED